MQTAIWEERLEQRIVKMLGGHSDYLALGLRMRVDELMVTGRAMMVHRVQMLSRDTITIFLVILGERGLITARRLSKVMASMVNTLAGTVEREMNWLREQ